MTSRTRSAVYLVRAWWEGDVFRARVTYRVDAGTGDEVKVLAADITEVHRQLDLWFAESATRRD